VTGTLRAWALDSKRICNCPPVRLTIVSCVVQVTRTILVSKWLKGRDLLILHIGTRVVTYTVNINSILSPFLFYSCSLVPSLLFGIIGT
jgi:hypothetical protein